MYIQVHKILFNYRQK